MTIDWTQPVETTEDPPLPVRVLATDRPGDFPMVVMHTDGAISTHTVYGTPIYEGGCRLRNVPPPKPGPVLLEGWVNLYSDQNIKGTMQHSKRSADDVAREGRVECRRVAWMSDGSPVPSEEKGLGGTFALKLNKMTSDRDDWRTKAEALQAEVDRQKAEADDLRTHLVKALNVVDAAVAGVDSFNRRGLLRLIEAVRTYQSQPKKSAAEAVANVSAKIGPVKNCTTCRFNCTLDLGHCINHGYRTWRAKSHD